MCIMQIDANGIFNNILTDITVIKYPWMDIGANKHEMQLYPSKEAIS